MTVFGGKNRTPRAVPDPGTDQVLPSPRALSWKLIATPLALRGVEGQHCQLIHGDHWREIKGSQVLDVKRDQHINIEGKCKETIAQDYCQNIIGPHLVVNHYIRNETALGRWSKVYGNTMITKHQDIYQFSTSHLEHFGYSETHHDTDVSCYTWAVSLNGLALQLAGAQAAGSLFTLSAALGTAELDVAHEEIHFSQSEVHGAHAET